MHALIYKHIHLNKNTQNYHICLSKNTQNHHIHLNKNTHNIHIHLNKIKTNLFKENNVCHLVNRAYWYMTVISTLRIHGSKVASWRTGWATHWVQSKHSIRRKIPFQYPSPPKSSYLAPKEFTIMNEIRHLMWYLCGLICKYIT